MAHTLSNRFMEITALQVVGLEDLVFGDVCDEFKHYMKVQC